MLSLRPLIGPGQDAIFARVPGSRRLPAGARVFFSWQPEHEHRFDAATGLRLPARDNPDLPRAEPAPMMLKG
jgi:hypothetical protein